MARSSKLFFITSPSKRILTTLSHLIHQSSLTSTSASLESAFTPFTEHGNICTFKSSLAFMILPKLVVNRYRET
ncbi:hypothetical protein BOTCAL_0215g00150 [Botryotinia calthae]|uniref:Uncharacterized protein n=1 Tax=Botryotinia calthae TaxID=38488 RepID=A0A4Y8D125_9HELO|nr:hypothetical protein BOTCAL_0215g00150 [Botryotinia calthae]